MEEIAKLRMENDALKIVLTNLVSKKSELFQPEELSVEVGEDAVVVQGSKDRNGNSNEGFSCLQFKWQFPLTKKVSEENSSNGGFHALNTAIENLDTGTRSEKRRNNELEQEVNNGSERQHNNKPEQLDNLHGLQIKQEPNNRHLSKKYKIFIVSDYGEKRKLDVESTDTIKTVKTRIQKKFGFDTNKQVLRYLSSGVMEDGKTVSEYFIENNYEVFLTMMTQTNIQICIKMIIGHSLEMEVEPTKSLVDLKSMIEKCKGIPVERQRLIFAGKQLDNFTTLEYNNIENGATIHLL